ncbi:hypothetical protein FTX61_07735 [Nitriliruptoraceae bacterium ZYF776]|nr:hypothetical protein [Profundirhabdus halotolerans]
MDAAERLAAYLADELPADERTAVEAELARDARLRAQLAALRRADDALATLTPTELPTGARARLDAVLAREFDELLGASAPAEDDTEVVPLAAKRAARPRWLPAAAAAAAALVVVVGGVRLIGPGGADQMVADVGEEAADAGSEASDDEAATLDAPAADSFAAEEAEDGGDAATGALPGPLLLAGDRELDDTTARDLLTDPDVLVLSDRALPFDEGAAVAGRYADGLGASDEVANRLFRAGRQLDDADVPVDDGQVGPTAEDEQTQPSRSESLTQTEVEVRREGGASEADLAAVGACLDVLLAEGTAIATYAELGTYEGEPAVAVVLVASDPADGDAFTGREVWVLGLERCQTRFYARG